MSEIRVVEPATDEENDREVDRHVSIKFESELIGGHVHITVRSACRHPSVQVNHSRGNCGKLVMDPESAALFHEFVTSSDFNETQPQWVARGDLVLKIGPAGWTHSTVDANEQKFIEWEGWPQT